MIPSPSTFLFCSSAWRDLDFAVQRQYRNHDTYPYRSATYPIARFCLLQLAVAESGNARTANRVEARATGFRLSQISDRRTKARLPRSTPAPVSQRFSASLFCCLALLCCRPVRNLFLNILPRLGFYRFGFYRSAILRLFEYLDRHRR